MANAQEALVPAQPGVEVPAKNPPSAAPAIEKLDAHRFRLGKIEFNQAARTVELPVAANTTAGQLEYILVHTEGKAHESLFTTVVSPTDFNVVLLLLNWKKSDAMFDFSQPERGGVLREKAEHIPESKLEISLKWMDEAGKEQLTPVEAWIHNIEQRAKISKGPFIYTGSYVGPDGVYMAQTGGSFIALYADPTAVINNPRAGNSSDDIWIPDPDMPTKGTPMTMILRAPAAKEKPAAPAASGPATAKPAAPAPAVKKAPPRKK